ncbi:hypothetical protein G7072_09425 [Nocardioides sp. HDW12B]|uniref:hypothetical protein n=1 Tax=Nocardioides sp. HDW12B TaxID=2714939 RepID=UPI00140BDF5F|nr:hypothetical protein [Nocardioides sp. HDW12B]QIK66543.1 hypothetical protein G7072_09425 [Nocardioides sp. HDW12B]
MRGDRRVGSRAPSRRTAALDSSCRRVVDHADRTDERDQPPWGRMAAVGLVAAPALLASPVALAAAGWVLASGGGPLAVLLAVALLLVAVGSWPRRSRRLDPSATLTAPEAPATFAVLGRVGAQVGAPPLHRLELAPALGAGVHRSGPSRRPVLSVGAVAWAGLSEQGRVALVAHEMAHLVRPELRLGRVTARAEATLEEWRLIAGGEPPRRAAGADDARRFVTTVSAVLLAPLRVVVVLWTRSLLRLQAPVTARGELLADRVAARVAGGVAVYEVWDLGLGAATWETALTRGLSGHEDLTTSLRTAVAAVPAESLASRRRASVEDGHRVDDDHPATDLRRRALEAVDLGDPLVVVVEAEARASATEMADGLARALRDAAQALRYAAPGSSLGQRSADAVRRHTRARNELDTAGGA